MLIHTLDDLAKARISVLSDFSWSVLCDLVLQSSNGEDGKKTDVQSIRRKLVS